MKTLFKFLFVRALALMMVASVAFAQDRGPFRQEELDQMLAPVALYPDSLLSQILMASTYPLEVVQASRWSQANPGLMGEDAVRAVERMDWDPSVKSLTAFPQVLTVMDERIEWTERLGEAFLVQRGDVLDTVQGLRRRAEAANTLRSSDQMHVAREGEVIVIREPARNLVYVPYYNPVVAYGAWWWPDYPPVYWAPPRAYYVVPAHRPVFIWGSGIVTSADFFFGRPDWRHRHVTVVHNYITVVNRNVTTVNVRPAVWEHNSVHRRGAPFRNAEARQRFEQARAATAETRRDAERNHAVQGAPRAGGDRAADIRRHRPEERRDVAQERREDRRIEGREPAVNRITPDHDGNRAGRVPANRNDDSRPTVVAPVTPAAASAANTPAALRQPAAPVGSSRAEASNDGDRGRQQNLARESPSAPRPAAIAPLPVPRAASNEERGDSARERGNRNQRERSVRRGDND